MSRGGSLFRGAALEVPDDSLEAWPAASTAPFNWVRNPGEKTSLHGALPQPRSTASPSCWRALPWTSALSVNHLPQA